MPEIAYVNGRFMPITEATISIDDRGFQFADSVYEVVVAFGQRPFRLDQHIRRLERSLALIDLEIDKSKYDFSAILTEGISRCQYDEAMAYLQVTRGVQPRSHIYQDGLTPTVIATFRPKPNIDSRLRESGISVVCVPDTRRSECEIKATALLPNILAINRARRDGYDDVIFVSTNGDVRESTSSNIFAVRNGTLFTPTSDEKILHGVTRELVLECAREMSIPVKESALTLSDFQSADEAFASSTVIDVLPITKINREPIGDGRPGPVASSLYRAFLNQIRNNS